MDLFLFMNSSYNLIPLRPERSSQPLKRNTENLVHRVPFWQEI